MYWWNIRGDSDISDDLRYIDERGRDGGFNNDQQHLLRRYHVGDMGYTVLGRPSLRRRILVVVIAVMLGVSGCVAVALAHTSRPAVHTDGSSQSSFSDSDMEYFRSKIADFGIELKPLDGVPSVTKDTAIAIARHEVGGDRIAKDAEHITAMYTSLSDYPAGPGESPLTLPGTTRIMKDVPVWIVTFHGVHMLHSGSCMIDASGKQIPSTRDPYVFGDTNVVLDAETGEVLEGFSYNTPS
jgi:hypothetical protein